MGRYVVVGTLGSGGMGVVYRAHDPALDRDVALKLVRKRGGAPLREEYRRRLAREGQALAALAHPNVVQVFDVGTHCGSIYIAMELVRGESLRAWLERARPTWRQTVAAFIGAGRGLWAAHRAGIVHRDLKPQNVLVDDAGAIKVVDFGLAVGLGRAGGQESSVATMDLAVHDSLTRSNQIVGTPRYMAPEQFTGGEVGPAADQFALCLCLYEALFGQRPYSGSSFGSLAVAVQRGRPQPIPWGTKVPRAIRRAVLKGLQREPHRRHPDVAALIDALQRGTRPRASRYAAVVVAGVGGALAWGAIAREPEVPCSGTRAQGGLWNDAQREAVSARFAAAAPEYGRQAWARVDDALDVRLRRWRRSYDAVCDGMPAARAAIDPSLSCLWSVHTQYAAAIDVLASADAAVFQAVDLVHALPGSAECAAQPTPGTRRAVGEQLAKARAQLGAGNPHAALAEVRALSTAMTPSEAPEAEAALMTLWGQIEHELGLLDAAAEHLRRAHALALASRLDSAAVASAAALMGVATEQARFDDAVDWSRHAQAAMSRQRGALRVHVDFLNRHAQLASRLGHHDEAVARREGALALARRLEPAEGGPLVARATGGLAMDLRAAGRLRESIVTHRAAMSLREAIYGERHPSVASSLLGLGMCHAELGEHREAEPLLRDALVRSQETYGADSPRLVPALGNLANTISAQGRHGEALPLYDRAVALGTGENGSASPAAVTWLANAGVALRQLGHHDRAIARHLEVLELQAGLYGRAHQRVAIAYAMLGETYEAAGDLDRARASFTSAADSFRADPHAPPGLLGRALLRLARVHDDASARPLLVEAVAILDEEQLDPTDLAEAQARLQRATPRTTRR